MYCSSLSLTNFRNYKQLDVELPNGPILVLGPNASGKTTLLEALYLLATTKSHRTNTDRELVNWNARAELGVPPFARVAAGVQRRGTQNLEIIVIREGTTEQDQGMARKRIKVNNLPRRAIDVIGQVNAVMFSPQDLDLIVGSPSLRRRYLDITISQIDPHYVRTLQTYQKIVLQRNSLLRSLADRGRRPGVNGDSDQLTYWDEELVRNGAYLLRRRLEVVGHLNRLADGLHARLAGTGEALEVLYRSSISDQTVPPTDVPDEEALRECYAKRLRSSRTEELRRAVTLAGPHRDDISFTVGGVDMGTYGSRGQQRSVILAVKLAEVELMQEATGEMPLLLLDDVVSELDPERRRYLLEAVLERRQQVLVTATDLIPVGREFLSRASLFETTSGGGLQARGR
ncbi:MAG: DNA replication/repair protein RecF [Chloroflexota bacterium]|nr:DNA replication/repair protein RecF [Chloroflexota bacterium]